MNDLDKLKSQGELNSQLLQETIALLKDIKEMLIVVFNFDTKE